jgi:hypothetical protein
MMVVKFLRFEKSGESKTVKERGWKSLEKVGLGFFY